MSTNKARARRHKRVRAKIAGDSKRPRMNVFRSLTNIYVQIIDDSKGVTLASADLRNLKGVKNNVEGAEKLGKEIAKKCKEAKISEVVFDRGGYKYHGKVKAVAQGARSEGLKF